MQTLAEMGQALQEARHKAGLTQSQLSELSGVARVTLSRMEGATKGDMSVAAVLRLCGAMGLELRLVPKGHRRTLEDVLREQRNG
jgi:transcriptional regulator with XRE-family HTH domain